MAVRIPGRAVAVDPPNNDDVAAPAVDLLRSLSLLPTEGDLAKANAPGAAFSGPPDSVAVLEAGATAASKGWSVVIAGSAAISTGSVVATWNFIGPTNQPFAILAIGFVLAAAGIGIAYLLGSDVRGRAAAMVATIDARQAVAIAILAEAGKSYKRVEPAAPAPTALPGYKVSNVTKAAADEVGWRAIATRDGKGGIEYLLVKGNETEWVPSKDVTFDAFPPTSGHG